MNKLTLKTLTAGTELCLCDPHVYKNCDPLRAEQGKLVSTDLTPDGRVRIEHEDGKEVTVTLAHIRCLWTEHEARIAGFEQAKVVRTAAEATALMDRQDRAKELLDSLHAAGCDARLTKDATAMVLSLDQVQQVVDALFPATDEEVEQDTEQAA